MGIEWIRRTLPRFDELARAILFRKGSVVREPDVGDDAQEDAQDDAPGHGDLGLGALGGSSDPPESAGAQQTSKES